jgi:hypothetical protein
MTQPSSTCARPVAKTADGLIVPIDAIAAALDDSSRAALDL